MDYFIFGLLEMLLPISNLLESRHWSSHLYVSCRMCDVSSGWFDRLSKNHYRLNFFSFSVYFDDISKSASNTTSQLGVRRANFCRRTDKEIKLQIINVVDVRMRTRTRAAMNSREITLKKLVVVLRVYLFGGGTCESPFLGRNRCDRKATSLDVLFAGSDKKNSAFICAQNGNNITDVES